MLCPFPHQMKGPALLPTRAMVPRSLTEQLTGHHLLLIVIHQKQQIQHCCSAVADVEWEIRPCRDFALFCVEHGQIAGCAHQAKSALNVNITKEMVLLTSEIFHQKNLFSGNRCQVVPRKQSVHTRFQDFGRSGSWLGGKLYRVATWHIPASRTRDNLTRDTKAHSAANVFFIYVQKKSIACAWCASSLV